ncbi:hypothetical protein NE237_007685 [Protea cynaroides]|uniref:glycerophosphodiester phosphodiesterase n=1 Tax=Protea cynaroides TaxID=273540 RepID=A0A9Q0KQP8_9MAGN|nr:hypothetical protein NE237_007685 [Protea cynaroides]
MVARKLLPRILLPHASLYATLHSELKQVFQLPFCIPSCATFFSSTAMALTTVNVSDNATPAPSSLKWPKFLVIGHRGSGMNILHIPDRRLQAIKENSVLSFNTAGKFGVDFVEFDVQVTKDDCPVIFHDNFILTTENGEITERRLTDLNLAEFLSYGPQREPGNVGKTLFRKTHEGKIFHWKVEEDDTSCTLQEAFQNVTPSLGFNIELKFDDTIDYKEEELIHVLQPILKVVFEYANDRPIVFSSFQPDAARLIRTLQSIYPVFFLTIGGAYTFPDVRKNSLEEAVKHCLACGLQGIVSETRAIFKNPGALNKIKEENLSLFTFGQLNVVPEAIYMQHLMGVDGVIVDLVPEIPKKVSEYIKPVKEAVNVSDVPCLDQIPENATLFSKGNNGTGTSLKWPKFLVMGHRGSGMNILHIPDRRFQAIKENSILSFNTAGKYGVDFVEFDVQVTKDGCPVIFHDYFILGEIFESRVIQINLAEFLSYGPQRKPGNKTLLRKTPQGKIFYWKVEEDDTSCTLQDAFQTVTPSLGFNIKLKFDDFIDYIDEELIHIPIVFSTFQPDAARLIKTLQSIYPNSLEEAVRLCLTCRLQGIVTEAKAIFKNPGALKKIKGENLSLFTYDGVIVDLVQEIPKKVSEYIKPDKEGEEDSLSEGNGQIQMATRPKFSQLELSFLQKLIPQLIQFTL